MKYRRRPKSMENTTFLQWLRLVDQKPNEPKPYKSGTTLVGLRFVSVYKNKIFFQRVLMHFPHRQLCDPYHGDADRMPDNLNYFAAANTLLPKTWNNGDSIRKQLEMEGHKNYLIDTFLAYFASLKDMLQLWRLQVIGNHQLLPLTP